MNEVDPNKDKRFCTCQIPSDLAHTSVPREEILQELQKHQYDEEAIFAIKLALEEALANAIRHGNRKDPDKPVTVRYCVSAERAVIIVRDEGEGFSPEKVPDPTVPERLSVPSGRGVMLIRAYMDEVEYRDCGREVWFIKNREGGAGCRESGDSAG